MEYRIKIMSMVWDDLDSIYIWIKTNQSTGAADSWLAEIHAVIKTLSTFPASCPVAPEGHQFGVEVRQRLYGNRRVAYRILFHITEDSDGPLVSVLRVRHSAQKNLRFDELNLN